MKIIFKISSCSAWLLVLITLFSLFTGLAAIKNFLISPSLGYSWHNNIMPFLFIPLFYIHSLAGIFLLLARHESLNKKIIKIVIGLIWTSIFGLLLFVYLAPNKTIGDQANTNGQIGSGNNLQNNQVANISLTAKEIAKHNLTTDCWMIINNKVYDFTNYLKAHPGGAGAILPYCGKDGTIGFDTKGTNKSHSSYANSLLNPFLLGNLDQAINNQAIQAVNSQTQNIPQGSGEFEEDDN